jgi:hypothetical protein
MALGAPRLQSESDIVAHAKPVARGQGIYLEEVGTLGVVTYKGELSISTHKEKQLALNQARKKRKSSTPTDKIHACIADSFQSDNMRSSHQIGPLTLLS